MVTKNDITGDKLRSKVSSEKYRNNWDLIFNSDKDRDPKKEKGKEENDSPDYK